jgi:hypothetical protein
MKQSRELFNGVSSDQEGDKATAALINWHERYRNEKVHIDMILGLCKMYKMGA